MGHIKKSDKEKLFDTQLGQRAAVYRTQEKSENIKAGNGMLRDIGTRLNPLPKNLTYHGSAAVHIYYNETLKQAFFVCQVHTLTDPRNKQTNELLSLAGLKDLIGTAIEYYGKRRPKLRSGF